MTNAFTLTTPDLSPVGVALSPICALFNHSCAPNAVIVFPKVGDGMVAQAIADIAPGEEVGCECFPISNPQVLTSYVDVSQPYAERQVEVRERYGFTCMCALCSQPETWVDPRWCVRHTGCKEDGVGRMPGELPCYRR